MGSGHMLVSTGHKLGVQGRGALANRGAGNSLPENPVSILSGDVTGCEWVDSACIRFNK